MNIHYSGGRLDKPGKKLKSKPGWPQVGGSGKVTDPESMLQGMAEQYLEARNVKPIRVPDLFWQSLINNPSIPVYVKKYISEYLKGLPDLIIPKRRGNETLILPLEIKTEKGIMSKAQLDWQETLGTVVTRGWEETLGVMEKFLNEE